MMTHFASNTPISGRFLPILLALGLLTITSVQAQYGSYSTYPSTRSTRSSGTYSVPSTNYGSYQSSPDTRYTNGYTKQNGTYVEPHRSTMPDNTNWNNYSTQGNSNPYTGQSGSRARDYSSDANNYGQGRDIQTGPRGGQYYYNDSGRKVYIPKQSNPY